MTIDGWDTNLGKQFRAINDWCVRDGSYRGGWPNFNSLDYLDGRGTVYGNCIAGPSVLDFRNVGQDEYQAHDNQSMFTGAWNYAMKNGYLTGFPNWNQARDSLKEEEPKLIAAVRAAIIKRNKWRRSAKELYRKGCSRQTRSDESSRQEGTRKNRGVGGEEESCRKCRQGRQSSDGSCWCWPKIKPGSYAFLGSLDCYITCKSVGLRIIELH